MKLFWTTVFVLLAAACTPMQWVRADADAAQADADSKDCQMQAWREARWNSFSYIGYPYYMYRDPYGPLLAPNRFGDPFGDRYIQETRLADFCMRSKGYELTQVEK
jgi:hypothetical protein